MSSIERVLAPDERVHLVTREHGVVLVPAFLRASLVLLGAGAVAVLVAGVGRLGVGRVAVAGIAGLLAAHALVRLIGRIHRWHMQQLVVTDRRMILFSGGLSRRVAAMPLDAIDAVEVRRPGGGRVLHYGSLVVTAGQRRGALFGLRRLPDPDLLLGLVLGLDEHIPAALGRGRAAPAAGPLPSAR